MSAPLVLLLLQIAASAQTPSAAAQASAFEKEIRPLLKQYCLTCHSAATHAGDLNLERFSSFPAVLKDPQPWQKVVEQLSLGEMPPKAAPQLSAAQKTQLLAWVNGALTAAAHARAGDPGPVVLRRLNNSEYTFTIRDLTGVPTLDPAREFPADGAAGEGFMNTGNSLSMSPALVSKYMEAGRDIAAHAVLLPSGLRFSPSTSRRDWTEETLAEIRALYAKYTEQGGQDTVTQQGIALDKNRGGTIPLRKYLAATLTLRDNPALSVASVAKKNDLSPKYLSALLKLMRAPGPSPVMDDLRARWRKAAPADLDGIVADIRVWQETLWKFNSVGHIGKADGPKSWMEAVTPILQEKEFRVKMGYPKSGAGEVKLYLAAHEAGDGATGDIVVWREPRLAIPGRPAIPLSGLRAFADQVIARRAQLFAAAAPALAAADEANGQPDLQALARRHNVDPGVLQSWFDYLGVNHPGGFSVELFSKKVERVGAFDFVKGWTGTGGLQLIANSSDQLVRVPGSMKPHSVAVHPSPSEEAAIGWTSPGPDVLRIQGAVTRVHAECGNGVSWVLELRRGGFRRKLAGGEARNAQPVPIGPLESVRVQRGDLLSLKIGPRDRNHSCDLTDVDLRLTGASGRTWSLAADVSGNVLAGNPNGPWSFYHEPVQDAAAGTGIPAGSLLARWLDAPSGAERAQLAAQLQALLAAPAPASGPDAELHRELSALAGPLVAANATAASAGSSASGNWGLDPALFGKRPTGGAINPSDLAVRAPSVVEVRLPADLAAGSEFVVTGALDPMAGAEGSVQMEVLDSKPTPHRKLVPTGTTVVALSGTWTSNNQAVVYGMPVIANRNSAARKRFEASFEEFRQMFPASLCYTKIVPVDEVVTLTLYHREDAHLSRLILDSAEAARLDRLWHELHYISRDALTLVDAFEQLYQYATQDADPSKFEPLRQPILDRAAAFRQELKDSEPRHVDAVVDLANRAYRRPLAEAEKTQLRDLYRKLRDQEIAHEDAIRLLLARVFVSPAFLYRAEKAPPGTQAAPVNPYDLANRLSYFLWSSQPDARLLAAAQSGKLQSPAGLVAETRRMMKDDRISRLATEFGAAWLHIHGFDSLDEKSERHFPTFNALRGDMYEESIRFLTDLFRNNRSILNLVDADYTFLNEALAKHYGIPGVAGPEWRRVDGVKQYGRGGVLGQASVLSKQSGASRTSPILRGNWVAEVLLGDRLPRPPKDVPPLPDDASSETLSMRQITERHVSDQRCAGCHSRIDPYGFALESFDAIGRLRKTDVDNQAIRDNATLRDGTSIEGAPGLRRYLAENSRDAFVRQFCRKLLGFALGRAVQLSDEPLLNQMQAQLSANGYSVGKAVEMIVASRQFREIRGRDAQQTE